ncbi:AraC family transcriptional regulator [uncultured Salinisphaera sp.]|uniref:AraC family transcriptional regulator n=1 Tax=uncultured Salinisphaera sp. TaxID=359372 RepID=UPI0032B15123
MVDISRNERAQGRFEHLAARIAPHISRDGFTPTALDGLSLLGYAGRTIRQPEVYQPSLVFVAQGEKTAYLEDRVIHYGAGHYLVQAMPVPFECETRGDSKVPVLGASLRIDPDVLDELVTSMPEHVWPATDPTATESLPMAAVALDSNMSDALTRLLDCLDDELSARALYAARVREVIFEAMRGPQGHLLRRLIHERGAYARIGTAINQLHTDYASSLSVADLAASVHMSASSFHHHFKRVTRLSPLQYQKRIRLLAARDLLASQVENVAGAAHAVGYESASQFSREYKRYFGVAPTHDRPRQAHTGTLALTDSARGIST